MSRASEIIGRLNAGTLIAWVAVLAVLLAIIIMASLAPRKEPDTAAAVPPALVRVIGVEARTLRETALLPGRIAANVSARLSAEKGGRIVSLAADKGDTVAAGQVLMQMDDRIWLALERQARIELADAERDLERWTQMKETGAVAQSEFDAVRRRRDLAAAAADQAAVHVEQCKLISPFEGIVDARLAETGEYVNEGQAVFSILDLTPLKVQMNLPERDVSAMRIGDRAPVKAPALGGAVFEGEVRFIAQEAAPQTFTYAAELTVENPPPGLRPGMMVDVEIERAMKEGAIAIPLASVIPRRGENLVFLAENGMAVRRVVVLESVAGQEALISAGLQPGELLIIEGHRTLQDGVAVQTEREE